jgi:selenocysteine lyase/cysteine desulfurase
VDVAEAQKLWSPAGTYLNTATYGLPAQPTWDAVQSALEDWHHGRTSYEHWNEKTDSARALFAQLVNVPAEDVVTGPAISALVGLVAAAVPDASRVLVPDGDFASVMFPFMAQADRGIEVRVVPLDRIAEEIDESTDLVAASLVQSSSGEVLDLDAVLGAARAHGALVVIDAIQGCGWLPLDASAADAVVVHGYKWLCSPRGTAFMYLRPELRERLRPNNAGWYAGVDPYASYYGPPMDLAESARSLDTSPAWFSWVGAEASLRTFLEIGVEKIHVHNVGLANRFRSGLGLEPSDTAIVSTSADASRFEDAGIQAAVRAGGLRASFHVYNTEDDVDAALAAIAA